MLKQWEFRSIRRRKGYGLQLRQNFLCFALLCFAINWCDFWAF